MGQTIYSRRQETDGLTIFNLAKRICFMVSASQHFWLYAGTKPARLASNALEKYTFMERKAVFRRVKHIFSPASKEILGALS
ncbi:hypothetical protein FEE96_13675 [Parasedimentitalea maritima]|uniref:Uncharacterized protein n=1 Tax=Parasedimentitalea maritima TaxID=2578117 RepID=A0ABY2UUX5_9RHOB|nr:hypothetical protein FEE96_13675 [Zongyanglinia marina]